MEFPFKKKLNIGILGTPVISKNSPTDSTVRVNIEINKKLIKNKEELCLSISGGIGRKHIGQIIMEFKEYDHRGSRSITEIRPMGNMTHDKIKVLFEIWDKHHMNDMNTGCEHQIGPEWEHRVLEDTENFTLSDRLFKLRHLAGMGELPVEEYEQYTKETREAWRVVSKNVRFVFPYIQELLDKDILKKDTYKNKNHETLYTSDTYEHQHPEGFLAKACPVCGYKYGTSWFYRPLPDHVLRFLDAL